jgi:Protein tyrosine and serine/threonine kinase
MSFALGSIIYELCTGREPYNEKTEEEVAQLYNKGERPNTSGLEMESIINKCWQAKYKDAAEVLKDIRECFQSSKSLTTPTPAGVHVTEHRNAL